jgi:hypothetical protein
MPFQMLARIAQRSDAVAAIAFLRDTDKTSVVDVWLLDRISGKATMRTLWIESTADAASVLAIRAVDLLRASLREFHTGERPPEDVAGVDRRPVPQAIEAFTEVPAPRPAFALAVDGLLLDDRTHLGLAYGPSVGAHYRAAERFEIGVMLAGPLVGGKWKAQKGSVSVRQELGWVEARYIFFATPRVELSFHAGAGGHFLQAQGEASPPPVARSDQVSSWLGTVGVRAQLNLSQQAAIAASLRAIGLTPRPGFAVAQENAVLDLPLVALSAGVVVGL